MSKRLSAKSQLDCIFSDNLNDCKDLLLFYITYIRPVTEYACQVFHNFLLKYLCEDPERLLKRALRIMYPGRSYSEALIISELPTLEQRRQQLTEKLFKEIVNDERHKLAHLLTKMLPQKYKLRSKQSVLSILIA